MTTDASKQRWGLARDDHTTGGRWTPTEAEKHINDLERKSSLRCLHCATMLEISSYAFCQMTQPLFVTLIIWVAVNPGLVTSLQKRLGNFLSSAHLPGTQNMLADREARVFNYRTEWMLHLDIFQDIFQDIFLRD